MNLAEAIILAIVEGLTEFLPVSSTGHMVIASAIMGINSLEFTKMFTVNIQFGAILSVVVLYHKRFIQSIDFYFKLLVAFIPAAILGFLLGDFIDLLLENVIVVAINLLIGGFFLLFVEDIFKKTPNDLESINYKKGFIIGCFQCIALAPGVSRSAATIIGGMAQNLSRKAAAEFSFFLAVPTMLAAASYKFVTDLLNLKISDLLKFDLEKIQQSFAAIPVNNIQMLIVGNIAAFIVAMLAIKFFINFLTK